MLFLNHRITNKIVVSVLLIYTSLSVTLVAAQKATKIDTLPSCCMKIPSRFSTNTHDSLQFHLTAEKSINGMVINYGMQKDMKFKRIINTILLQLITVLKLIF